VRPEDNYELYFEQRPGVGTCGTPDVPDSASDRFALYWQFVPRSDSNDLRGRVHETAANYVVKEYTADNKAQCAKVCVKMPNCVAISLLKGSKGEQWCMVSTWNDLGESRGLRTALAMDDDPGTLSIDKAHAAIKPGHCAWWYVDQKSCECHVIHKNLFFKDNDQQAVAIGQLKTAKFKARNTEFTRCKNQFEECYFWDCKKPDGSSECCTNKYFRRLNYPFGSLDKCWPYRHSHYEKGWHNGIMDAPCTGKDPYGYNLDVKRCMENTQFTKSRRDLCKNECGTADDNHNGQAGPKKIPPPMTKEQCSKNGLTLYKRTTDGRVRCGSAGGFMPNEVLA
jgi:hypothetical protein